jgi:sec-independent protein translocase protein TatC
MSADKQPFINHLHELRKRLLYCAVGLLLGGILAYMLQERLVRLIIRPLGQGLYYSNPTGGFNFLFSICLLFGILMTLPVFVYNIVRFSTPALNKNLRINIVAVVCASLALAAAGICFAYLFSLPAALHFLASFGKDEVKPLIFAGDYLNFVISYLLSFAIIFQLPVVISFINTIKPLTPGGMMKYQRYIILISFIAAAVITPTSDPLNQCIMAAPVIVLYQFSIVYIWLFNRRLASPMADLDIPESLYDGSELDMLDESPETEAAVPSAAKELDAKPAFQAVTVTGGLSIDGVRRMGPPTAYAKRPLAPPVRPRVDPGRAISDFITVPRPFSTQLGRGRLNA